MASTDKSSSGSARTGGRLRRSSSSSARRHPHSRSQKKILRLQLVAAGLGAALILVIGGWSLTGVKLALVNSELAELETTHRKQLAEARELADEIDRLDDAMADLKEEMAALVEKRIPGLMPLEFDATLPVEHDYVRNVSFTVVGSSADKQYEYRAVLQNPDNSLIQATVKIHVFDELGVEAGSAFVSANQGTEGPKKVSLEAGETKTFHGFLSLIRNAEPRYFLVTVR